MPQHLSLTMTCPFRPTHHPLSILTHVIACMSTLARRLVTSGCDLSTGHPSGPSPDPGCRQCSYLTLPNWAPMTQRRRAICPRPPAGVRWAQMNSVHLPPGPLFDLLHWMSCRQQSDHLPGLPGKSCSQEADSEH